jgi:hypothetical protein
MKRGVFGMVEIEVLKSEAEPLTESRENVQQDIALDCE